MNCPKCGTFNDDTAKFCSSCGSALLPPVQQAPPVAPPVYQAPPMAPPVYQAPPMAPPPMAAPGQMPSPAPVMSAGAAMQPPAKPYKAEFVMGLIGSIMGIIIFLIMLIVGIAAATASYALSYGYYSYGFGGAAIIGSIFVLVAFILGFVGTSQVNRGNGKGGVLLTVGGGLGFLAMFFGIFVGWSTIFFYPLLLTAGIMALARRKKVESGMY